MLDIEYLGHSCFRICCDEGVFVTDPFDEIGYEMPKVKADYVTISHGHYDHCNAMAVKGVEHVYTHAYRHANGMVEGFLSYHDDAQGKLRGENVIFKMHLQGVTLCHMGDIGEPPRADLLKFLKEVDVLFLPVGGIYTVDAKGAKAYVDAVAPKLVIPMHYNDEESNIRLGELSDFLGLFPQEKIICESGKFDVELPETTHVLVLDRRK